jgi:PknH-like extracellular domain
MKRLVLTHNAFAIRWVVVACAAAVAVSACAHHSGSPAKSGATPVGIDGLIVGVEDVRRIANADDLAPQAPDLHSPPRGDVNAPGPCRAVGHSDLTFGTGWQEFRSAGYNGVTDDTIPGGNSLVNEVTQAVARYPNSNTARGALDRLETTLRACADLHDPNFEFTLEKTDPSTLRITGHEWSHLYREKGGVMVSVGVVGLEAAEQVADTVVQMISDRIS